jgi:hypothetical protein
MGKWQWQLKRHFKPKIFNKLPLNILQKYANTFNIKSSMFKSELFDKDFDFYEDLDDFEGLQERLGADFFLNSILYQILSKEHDGWKLMIVKNNRRDRSEYYKRLKKIKSKVKL